MIHHVPVDMPSRKIFKSTLQISYFLITIILLLLFYQDCKLIYYSCFLRNNRCIVLLNILCIQL